MSIMFKPPETALTAFRWWQVFGFGHGNDRLLARVRGAQIANIYEHAKINMASMLLNAAVLLLALRGHPRFLLIQGWCATVGLLASLWYLRTRHHTSARNASNITQRQFWLATLEMSLFSILWATMLVIAVPHASEDQIDLLLTFSVSAVAVIGLVASTTPAAAILSATVVVVTLLTVGATNSVFLIVSLLTLWLHIARGSFLTTRAMFARMLIQEDLRERNAVVRLLLKEFEDNGTEWLLEVNAAGEITHASGRFAEALGRSYTDLIGMHFLHHVGGDYLSDPGMTEVRTAFEARRPFRDIVVSARVNGENRWWSLSGTPIFAPDTSFTGYRGVGRDVTDSRRNEEHIFRLARYDPLTGLANRALFLETLDAGIMGASAASPLALMFIDLDRFKEVNDSLGHAAGDSVLVEVSARMRKLLGRDVALARLGGDEFAALLSAGAHSSIPEIADALVEALELPIRVGNEHITIGASVGWSMAPIDGENAEELLKSADLALYEAKEAGRGQALRYLPNMKARAEARRAIETELPGALGRGELFLNFQPIVDTATEQIVTFEALLRWSHPELGEIAPDRFIPVAEESGAIIEIGRWVIEEACRQASTWPESVSVAVNMSPAQIADPELVRVVECAIESTGLSPARLELEITERLFLEETVETASRLGALNAIGIRFVLDDFGTGYSSIGYLKQAMFSRIKIDRSFVSDAHEGGEAAAIIDAVVRLADHLKMTTTAEGAETRAEFEACRDLGCARAQGYLFGQAVSANEARQLATRSGRVPAGGVGYEGSAAGRTRAFDIAL